MDILIGIIAFHAGIIGMGFLLCAAAAEMDEAPEGRKLSVWEVFCCAVFSFMDFVYFPSLSNGEDRENCRRLGRTARLGGGLLLFAIACVFYLGMISE